MKRKIKYKRKIKNVKFTIFDSDIIGIIRELNKKFLIYCYYIYTIDIWSMLAINSLTLISIY